MRNTLSPLLLLSLLAAAPARADLHITRDHAAMSTNTSRGISASAIAMSVSSSMASAIRPARWYSASFR